MAIVIAFIVVALLGGILGLGLAYADKKLAIEKDEKLIKLEAIMPGANCGGCGYAGCAAYAQAVFKGEAEPGLCAPGGNSLTAKMGEILGVEVTSSEKMVAYVFCDADCESKKQDFSYEGIIDCNAASILYKGNNQCKYGCIGLGSCISVCDQGAIVRNDKGKISVIPELCIGCKKCTKVCPTGVIKMVPASQEYVVACNSHDKGGLVRSACERGCIGCKICQIKFPESGCKVDDFLATVASNSDWDKTAEAAEACPRKIIIPRK